MTDVLCRLLVREGTERSITIEGDECAACGYAAHFVKQHRGAVTFVELVGDGSVHRVACMLAWPFLITACKSVPRDEALDELKREGVRF